MCAKCIEKNYNSFCKMSRNNGDYITVIIILLLL
jgi:hypothetical protein